MLPDLLILLPQSLFNGEAGVGSCETAWGIPLALCLPLLPGMDLALKFSLSPCVAPSQLSFLLSG